MLTNTKTLFASLVKTAQADCICDIGSRDGMQALLFRHLRPDAQVHAFEANPVNFAVMSRDSRLSAEGIKIHPCLIADKNGTIDFFVEDIDYADPEANRGRSSMLHRPAEKVKEVVKAPAYRIDTFLAEHAGQAKRMCLWIDAEGAEYFIVQGMSGIKDRVFAIHVETSTFEMFLGQRLYPELKELLRTFGFSPCGDNMDQGRRWGDVVFIRDDWRKELGFRFTLLKWKAYLTYWFGADKIAVSLKARMPSMYHFLRRLFIKFA